MEEWRSIPSYPGYEASSLGRIRTRAHKVLPGTPQPTGHIRVGIQIASNKQIKRYAHVLVCEAFNGPCPPGKECRHKDGVSNNNVPDNLCWGTRQENQDDRIAHGTTIRGTRHPKASLTEEQVRRIYARAWSGELQAVICAEEHVDQSTVTHIKHGRSWSSVTGHNSKIEKAS